MSGAELLALRGLAKRYRARRAASGGPFSLAPRRDPEVRALDGVSLSVAEGETLALVGESGSGKTTLARCALRLVEPDQGAIAWSGRDGATVDVRSLSGRALRRWRREAQLVFQDPWASLNPRLPVREIVGESLRVHGIARGTELASRVDALLERVGLSPAHAARFPHALSGGQRQRVGIARALALEPRLVVLDEPVAALDPSLAAQVLDLLRDLQRERGLAYLLIAHDLRIVRRVAARVAVMRAGRIVEQGPVERVFAAPEHEHTRALLAAVPRISPRIEPRDAGRL